MQNEPQYPIGSVDRALLLIQILQQEGEIRLSDAAERLGVASSTAHRLLAMLVFRGFAAKSDDGKYIAGLMSGRREPAINSENVMRDLASQHLQSLVAEVNETSHLAVRIGTYVKFIATVECHRVLRVGTRVGATMPAHLAALGKALLAPITSSDIDNLYRESNIDLSALQRELRRVRNLGFALNDQQTEPGLTALSVAVFDSSRVPLAAISVSLPSARFNPRQIRTIVSALQNTAQNFERDLISSMPRLVGH